MIDEPRIGSGAPLHSGPLGEAQEGFPPAHPSGEESFVHVLKDSIARVNSLQTEADKTIQEFSTGQDGVTLHQTMIEMAQADVSFHLMMQVRDRIVKAYQEMNNMPL
ncbi:MAG: flagellar hook-basal body complex protein FliE [Nitrospiraceae bacterium]|nr:flagellar hook-basal body complex protein FliE [Nitrospiraceae bacterium]